MYNVIAVMGKSGSGKDTFVKEALRREPSLHNLVSYTTRPIRENEINGVDYHFISEDDFIEQINSNKMLEYNIFNQWYYGTSIEDFSTEKVNIGVFNPQGVRDLIKNDNVNVTVLYLTTNDKIRLIRQLNREDNPNVDEIIRRYSTDKKDFSDLTFKYNKLVNNSVADLAVNLSILSSFLKEILGQK